MSPRRLILVIPRILLYLAAVPAFAAPRACAGSVPVGTFRLLVKPAGAGAALPVRSVNAIPAGATILYEPGRMPADLSKKAEVAVVLAPSPAAQELAVLDPKPAAEAASWSVPDPVSVVTLVFGPAGLSVKKIRSLVDKNQELLTQLADYAEQTSRVETMVEVLANAEQSGSGLDSALRGFSAQYGTALPKLDPKASTDQQAASLLKALMPAAASYDPLSQRSMMQQSAGLAASLASLFFGTPVGLAAGGASLFQNLRTAMFPDTEFRTAFAQTSSSEGLALCAKPQPAKSRTRLAYLWAHRVPSFATPAPALIAGAHVPAGLKSEVKIKAGKHLERARDWRLVAPSGDPVPVNVSAAPDALTVDLKETKVVPGQYRLRAMWDWEPLEVSGTVDVHAMPDLKTARLTPGSQDRLVQGAGKIAVELRGDDFEFVEKLKFGAREIPFALPKGPRAGVQPSLGFELDLTGIEKGRYRFTVVQSDGIAREIPFEVHPPNPVLTGLPLRVNLEEDHQSVTLRGSHLDRIEAILSDSADFEVRKGVAIVRLRPGASRGILPLRLRVRDLHELLEVEKALEVAGPRPKITAVRRSEASSGPVALREGEVESGSPAAFALSVEHMDTSLTMTLACTESNYVRQTITLAPGDRISGAKLDRAGESMLFVSADPGVIGQPGCRLQATIDAQNIGTSDPVTLGAVVRLPRIEKFVLTDEPAGPGRYVGLIHGQDLDLIEKTGWDSAAGIPVQGLPAPAPDNPARQVLRVVLSWPSPAPHAPIFVWL